MQVREKNPELCTRTSLPYSEILHNHPSCVKRKICCLATEIIHWTHDLLRFAGEEKKKALQTVENAQWRRNVYILLLAWHVVISCFFPAIHMWSSPLCRKKYRKLNFFCSNPSGINWRRPSHVDHSTKGQWVGTNFVTKASSKFFLLVLNGPCTCSPNMSHEPWQPSYRTGLLAACVCPEGVP